VAGGAHQSRRLRRDAPGRAVAHERRFATATLCTQFFACISSTPLIVVSAISLWEWPYAIEVDARHLACDPRRHVVARQAGGDRCRTSPGSTGHCAW
jgi:hypothetical protein